MGFRETLQDICKKVDGALAASVMGYDGIAIDSHEVDPSTLWLAASIRSGGRPVCARYVTS